MIIVYCILYFTFLANCVKMIPSININNRIELRTLLLSVDPETKPLWGKMNVLQMVEHLVEQVKWTNGKKVCTCETSAEEAFKSKQKWVYTDAIIPKNLPGIDIPERPEHENIETAMIQLLKELDDFDEYFKEPGITAIHGGYGAMNYNEWLIWHNKHFTHHLKQFNLF